MCKKITFLVLLVFGFVVARATYQTIPLTASSYNTDVVANGVGAPSVTSNAALDDASATTGYVFCAEDYNYDGTCSPITAPYFLPASGTLTSSATTTYPGVSYQLASYSGNNCLRLLSGANTGTLTFVTPTAAGEVFLLLNSGAAASTIDISINFADAGPSQVATGVSVLDWYTVSAATTVIKASRVSRTKITCGNDGTPASDNGPCLYQLQIPILAANLSRQIASITITRTNTTTSYVNLMAVSINTPCATPADQPTALNLTPTTSQVSGSFTAAASNPSGYLVVRYPAGSTPTDPVAGTNYTTGQSLGLGSVVYMGNLNTFTSVGLFANTSYDFYVYSYNNTSCGGGPLYNITAPLMSSVTTAACGGPANVTLTVGPTGYYATLTAAIADLSSTGISGPVVLELQSGYLSSNEPSFPIVLGFNPCISTTNTLTIRPEAGANGLMITSSNAGPTIDFDGASNIIIDGSPGGVSGLNSNSLQIINTNTAGAAIRFINDASNNLIKYCDLQGQNTSNTTSALCGVVYFSTAGVNLLGNDNNTLNFCNIHGVSSATTPAIAVASYGSNSSAAAYNDNCVISFCNVYDYFQAGTSSYGIKLDQGNSAWTLSNNNLYQSIARQYSASSAHKGMHINSNGSGSSTMTPQGSGFTIINNTIGGDGLGGNTVMSGTSNTLTHTYMGMDISVGVGAPTSVQNNTISKIQFSSGSTATGNFVGINLNYGNVNINHNTIGDPSGNSSILITKTNSTTAASPIGIRISGGITNHVDTNTIAGIEVTSINTTVTCNFYGIYATGGSGTNSITGNTIGSETVFNSINLSNASLTNSQTLRAIYVTGGTATTVANNTIAHLINTATGTSTQTAGIYVSGSLANVLNNQIHDLACAAPNTGGGTSAATLGIAFTSGTAGYSVTGNTIYNLTSYNATANVNSVGMFISAAGSGMNKVSKNFIYKLYTPSTGTGAIISGIDVGGGAANFFNNMISLGYDTAANNISSPGLCIRGITKGTGTANNFYHNSIYIGGSADGTGTANTFAFQRNNQSGTDTIQDNIFVNDRTNLNGATGKHYAISFGTNTSTGGNTSGVNLNFNLYNVPSSAAGGVMGYNTADVPAFSAGWVSGDINSIFAAPNFFEPINGAGSGIPDLHIVGSTPIESAGAPIAIVTEDFDGDVRASNTPTDIGADAGLFIPIDISAPVVSYTALANVCNANDRVITATITDATGVATGGLEPRIYFRNGLGLWSSTAGTLSSGTLTNGTWDFTISSALLGTLNPGNQIYYYIIAQDITAAGNIASNPGGAVATDVNNITTDPATPNSYTVGTNLAGVYDIGGSGNFTTLTSAVGIYNSCPVAGAVTFNLIDATYPNETFPISINANAGASASNTLTIAPATGNSVTISGSAASSGLIKLNGADYVMIDGSNSGGTDRNLTITNTSTSTPAAIQIVSLGAGAGATNNTVKNCNLSTGTSSGTSYGIAVGGVTPGNSGDDNDTITLQNNGITGISNGIYAFGTASITAGGMDNLSIINNGITVNATTTPYGIRVGNGLNSIISGDTLSVSTTTGTSPVAISLEGGFISSTVSRNTITKVYTASTGGWGSRGITVGSGTATSGLTIANNVIYNVNGSNYSGFTNSSSMGICIGAIGNSTTLTTTAGGINIYNNTVNMYGSYSYAASCLTAAIYVGTGASALDIRNNIFMNSMNNTSSSGTGSKNYAIYSAAGNGVYAKLNYNMYNVSGTQGMLGYLGSNKTTLDDLRAATLKDTSSLSGTIPFLADNDLHLDGTLPAAWNVFGRGIAMPALGTDIDGNVRSTTVGIPVTLGAYEIATPSSIPDDMVMTPAAPVAGTPTVFTSAGRKIAEINWTGSVPTTFSAKYYPGVPPPSPNTSPNINSYFAVLSVPAVGIDYTIKTYYTEAEANGIPDANLSMIKRDDTNPWVFTSTSNATADANGRYLTSIALNAFSEFSLSGDINPLGVSLVAFNGVQKGAINQLHWETANETNNSGFELQRSADGKRFDKLAFIASKAKSGTSTEQLSYQYDDALPLTGNNYYRLKQIDLSGRISYSNIVLLSRREGGNMYVGNVYPNPAGSFISMSLYLPKDEQVTYSILDVTGKVIMQSAAAVTKGDNTLNWNIAGLAAGNYLIRITTAEGSQAVQFTKD